MANVERVYTISLGRIYEESRPKRGRIAIREIKAHARRHLKASDVRIGTALNHFIFRDSMASPPRRVKVRAVKDDSGLVRLDLFGLTPDEAQKGATPTPAGKPAAEKKAVQEAADKAKESAKKPLSEAEKTAEKEALKAELKK